MLLLLLLAACQAPAPAPATATPPVPTAAPSATPAPPKATPQPETPPTPAPEKSTLCESHATSEYVLPYPVGVTYRVLQGFDGRWSHYDAFQYAVDFDTPIGSPVTAARAGRVVFVEESFTDADSGMENANVVIVRHADGTYGRYVHLTYNGALVEVDQSVAQGDPVGLSGSSGIPELPHLHFDVTQDCPQSTCQTIPVCYQNTQAHPAGLVVGESYTAEPY